jgi:hypothetical protein
MAENVREVVSEWVSPHSHLDHGLNRDQVVEILTNLHDEIAPVLAKGKVYRETHYWWAFFHSDDRPDLKTGLYGPIAGDPPVKEEEVEYVVRGTRPHPSRMVNRPMRNTNLVTVIVGLHEGKPTLYTVFGGPLAPREPTPDSSPDSEEVLFWQDHALAKD